MMGYALIIGVVIGICTLINRIKKRPVVNYGFSAAIVVLVVAVADIGLGFYLLSGRPDIQSFEKARFLGQITGRALIPLVASVFIGFDFRKRHGQDEPTVISGDAANQ